MMQCHTQYSNRTRHCNTTHTPLQYHTYTFVLSRTHHCNTTHTPLQYHTRAIVISQAHCCNITKTYTIAIAHHTILSLLFSFPCFLLFNSYTLCVFCASMICKQYICRTGVYHPKSIVACFVYVSVWVNFRTFPLERRVHLKKIS